ncbi:DUF3069 domain-containing protein [Photobacterium nomapromontoriensis]|uniref:DUF3069 domain-containing protein n=1 Tax=Photobacterium nomapromontoriensis TaxID=2910237 RepID=UPI003D11C331
MSDIENKEELNVAEVNFTLDDCSPELHHVIKFEEVPEELHDMLINVYKASEPTSREAWNQLPASAQNVLDNFEQFHALIALSQCYSGIDFLGEMQETNKPSDMTDEEFTDYKAVTLDKVLHNCVKDMCKQLKKARQNPPMKREFQEIFQK